ncbi:MAG: ComF family protein [Bacteroidota bacterium]|nr:ComF family protein [Bacteroidota bacterium]
MMAGTIGLPLKSALNDLLDLFYPQACAACANTLQKDEEHICLFCQHTLPRTDFHLERGNPLEKVFWGRFPIEAGGAFLYFKKGSSVQELLHNIKYRGTKEAAETLGRWYGEQLREEPIFLGVDYVVPVPLHRKKLRKRGYNQSEWFGEGIAKGMGKDMDTANLIRTQNTESQTKKGRFNRWQNVAEVFRIEKNKYFAGKHVLLVDDVVTTGSTLEACAQTLLNDDPNTKISIVTLAFAT